MLTRSLAATALLCLCFAQLTRAQPVTQPKSQYVAVMSSFPEELEAIKQLLKIDPAKVATETINGVAFKAVDIDDQHLLFFVTGMGLVNAAMNTQLALDHFNTSAMLFTGIAGGIDPSLSPGDVVIPQRWHYHGETAYFNETTPGQFAIADYFKPKYGHFGMIFPGDVTVRRADSKDWAQQASFDADEKLLALARTATATMPPMKFGDRACKVVIGGDGVSGTVFCDNADYRKFVFQTWKAECLDMESTAIAHVCWQNAKPCLIVRGLSDLAGGQSGKNTVDDYLKAAADDSARVLAAILMQMRTNGKAAN